MPQAHRHDEGQGESLEGARPEDHPDDQIAFLIPSPRQCGTPYSRLVRKVRSVYRGLVLVACYFGLGDPSICLCLGFRV